MTAPVPRKKPTTIVPFAQVKPGEPPAPKTTLPKNNPWPPVMDQVRRLNGTSAQILAHPRGREKAGWLRTQFPEFEFVTRTIDAGGKTTCGVWARLKVVSRPPPDAQTGNGIGEPELG
jgi:hypothetical protein